MNICLARNDETELDEMKGCLLQNEKMARYTSWRVGGPADCMYMPGDRSDLLDFLQIEENRQPYFWIGLGSNLLVRDGGIRGTVINTRGRLRKMSMLADGSVYVEAGVACAHVARFCSEQRLTGAEFLAGIPGTMGGALKMNAGAFGGETWAIVESVDMTDCHGRVNTYTPDEFRIAYRSVKGHEQEWFLASRLHLYSGNTEQSQGRIRELLALRGQTQPTNQPTCGSVFKNPDKDYAARLIEACDLKGFRVGGAQVSDKHANFIVNTGQATAADIENLIDYIRSEVERQQHVRLETEVCIVGQKR